MFNAGVSMLCILLSRLYCCLYHLNMYENKFYIFEYRNIKFFVALSILSLTFSNEIFSLKFLH